MILRMLELPILKKTQGAGVIPLLLADFTFVLCEALHALRIIGFIPAHRIRGDDCAYGRKAVMGKT